MRQNAFFLLKVINTAVFCEFFNKNIINPVYFIVGYYYNFFYICDQVCDYLFADVQFNTRRFESKLCLNVTSKVIILQFASLRIIFYNIDRVIGRWCLNAVIGFNKQ